MKRKLILYTLLLVILVSNATAFLETKSYDSEKKEVIVYDWLGLFDTYSVTLLENTDECFDCYTDYKVCNLKNEDLSFDDLGFKFYNHKNTELMYDSKIQVPETTLEYNVVFEYEPCTLTLKKDSPILKKLAGEKYNTSCVSGNYTQVKSKTVWVDTTFDKVKSLSKDECVQVRVKGKLTPGGSIDNRLNLLGVEIEEFVPWNNSWVKGQNVTINNPTDQTLYNFTFWFNVTYNSNMQTDGDDLRFIDAPCNQGGDELKYKNGESSASAYFTRYVKIPSIAPGDNIICMQYNNSIAVNNQDSPNAWDVDFLSVWQFNNTGTTNRTDSTLNSFDLEPTNYEADEYQVDSPTMGYDNLSGNDILNRGFGGAMSPGDTWTAEAFIRTDGMATFATVFSQIALGGAFDGIMVMGGDGTVFRCRLGGDSTTDKEGTSNIEDGVWHHVACRVNNSMGYVYVDGVEEAIHGTVGDPGDYTYQLGDTTANTPYTGGMDEIRLSNTTRTAEWLNMTHLNFLHYTEIVTFGTEEDTSGGAPPVSDVPTVTNPIFFPASPNSTQQVNCNTTPVDATNTSMDIEYWWYNGTVEMLNGNTTGVANNTNTLITTLGFGNTTDGDTWNCTVRAFDGTNYSSFASSVVSITDTVATTCTPPAINTNWTVNAEETCNLTTNRNQGTGYFILNGTSGLVNIEANITVGGFVDRCGSGCKMTWTIGNWMAIG